jgi:hypothetical protein
VRRDGGHLPLYCTGVATVIPAHAPAEVVTATLANLVSVTPHTVTPHTVVDPAAPAGQMDRIRRDGYATTTDEMTISPSRGWRPTGSAGHCTELVPARNLHRAGGQRATYSRRRGSGRVVRRSWVDRPAVTATQMTAGLTRNGTTT